MEMNLYRVPAVGAHKAYIAGLADAVRETLSIWEKTNA